MAFPISTGGSITNGSAVRQIVLSGELIALIRPSVVSTIQHYLSFPDRERWVVMQLADAFAVTPREVGFDFESWNDYASAESSVRYPKYLGGLGVGYGPPVPAPGY